jgi:C-terminal processing protease CtpA/Prc
LRGFCYKPRFIESNVPEIPAMTNGLKLSQRLQWAALMVCLAALEHGFAQDEKLGYYDRGMSRAMLTSVHDDLKRYYYDKQFHGVDIDATFREAEEKIKAAPTMNHALSDIAAALSTLNDSHTFFLVPPRPYRHDYGWRMQPVGDSDIFIVAVRPGSDAEKNGLRAGDQVLSVNGYAAIREDMWKIFYVFNILRPQRSLRLVVRKPDGGTQQIDALAAMTPTKELGDLTDLFGEIAGGMRHAERDVEYGKPAIIWKLPSFVHFPGDADHMLDTIRAHDALVLDLRGNPGGSVEFLERFLGGMFDHEVKIADRIGRKTLKPSLTKPRGDKTFAGKLVVLVDSQSGSAAELFARTVQLEKRGIVLGDRSSGSVMEARHYGHQSGGSIITFYGASITEADLIMTDGKSLEHSGVAPDERMLPTAADLSSGRDPVLAHAAQLVGVKLSPEEAGKLFPVEWPHE